jgi:hypothetical protein
MSFLAGFDKTASFLRTVRQTASLLTSKPAKSGALYGAVGGAVSGAANAPEGEGLDGALKGALLGGAAGGIGGAGYRRMQSMDRLEQLQKRNKKFGTPSWSKQKNPASWYKGLKEEKQVRSRSLKNSEAPVAQKPKKIKQDQPPTVDKEGS